MFTFTVALAAEPTPTLRASDRHKSSKRSRLILLR